MASSTKGPIAGYPAHDPRFNIRVGCNAAHLANDRKLAAGGKVMRRAQAITAARGDNLIRTQYVLAAIAESAGESAEDAQRAIFGSPEVDRLKARQARVRTKARKAAAAKKRTRKSPAKKRTSASRAKSQK